MKFIVDVTLSEDAAVLEPDDIGDRILDFLCSDDVLTIVESWDSVEPVVER